MSLVISGEEAKVYDAAAKKWTKTQQLTALAEESAELSAAASRMVLGKGNEVDFLEECADVEIMLEQMQHTYFDPADMDRMKEMKLNKLRHHLGML